MAIGRGFDLLFTRLASAGLVRPGMRMLALFFDDPALVPERELRAQAAVAGFAPPQSDDIGLLSTSIAARARRCAPSRQCGGCCRQTRRH